MTIEARRLGSALGISFWLGCGGNGGIGHDDCFGAARCDAPEASALPVVEALLAHEVSSSFGDAPAPTTMTLDLSGGLPGALSLTRDVAGRLLVARCLPDGAELELLAFDGSGALVERTRVTPPAAVAAATDPRCGYAEFSSQASISGDSAPGQPPLLAVTWRSVCPATDADPSGSCQHHWLALLSDDLDPAPAWVDDPDFAHPALRTADGGLCTGSVTVPLSCYDSAGVLRARQSALSDQLLRSGFPYDLQLELAPRPSGGLLAFAAQAEDRSSNYELWTLDALGTPLVRQTLDFPTPSRRIALAVDVRERPLLFFSDNDGDVSVVRLAADGTQVESAWLFRQEEYPELEVGGLSEDGVGNLYWRLEIGTRSQPLDLLCKLPLEGEPGCYRAGGDSIRQLLGAEGEGVLVRRVPSALESDDGVAAEPVSLEHYVLP